MGIVFSGSGHALPKNICSNEDLSKIVDTSDEVIDIIEKFYLKYNLKPNF